MAVVLTLHLPKGFLYEVEGTAKRAKGLNFTCRLFHCCCIDGSRPAAHSLLIMPSVVNRRLWELNAETCIHFPGRKGLDIPAVLVYAELIVCLNCGFTEFVLVTPNLEDLEIPTARSCQAKRIVLMNGHARRRQ